eukprot:CAMPEP_0206527328 /NCGR_PEP_ID=MMETSP0325_2-20121206/1283_1 /ASSEMBLY_ACC=CAM_ASM_000347 /TAXON_ID=2866 /ORGANISM="Crypthecodinium cohnii, Strain Seligo" /LENGTH=74 /DNA_ID=CAMNT_0054022717 /DNA_START=565 /DNA_END=785 /DNA_ORIENTATION=-
MRGWPLQQEIRRSVEVCLRRVAAPIENGTFDAAQIEDRGGPGKPRAKDGEVPCFAIHAKIKKVDVNIIHSTTHP